MEREPIFSDKSISSLLTSKEADRSHMDSWRDGQLLRMKPPENYHKRMRKQTVTRQSLDARLLKCTKSNQIQPCARVPLKFARIRAHSLSCAIRVALKSNGSHHVQYLNMKVPLRVVYPTFRHARINATTAVIPRDSEWPCGQCLLPLGLFSFHRGCVENGKDTPARRRI